MPSTTIYVGYICPLCERRVVVLCSSSPALNAGKLFTNDEIESECKCGFVRPIRMSDIQTLQVWRDTPDKPQ